MSRSNTTDPNYGFNNKRFSNYFDELSRLHPIVEETPKIYTNIETTNYQSRKRIENGQIVYDYSNSSHEKSSSNTEPPNRVSATANETNNCQTTAAAAANFNNSPFDVNIDNKAFVGEALSANQIAENRYCKYAECKNSRTDDSVHHHHSNLTTSEKQQPDESLKKITTEPQESCNPNSRSSFKEFDFVPKIFSNFFRTNKTEGEQCGSAVITKESSETTTVQTNTENINVTNRCEIIGSGGGSSTRNSVSPLPLRKSEWYSSTQSLYDLFGEEIDPMPGSPSASVLGVRGVTHRGRISPNPIRAPRINDSPNTNTTSTTSDYSQHHHHQHQHQHHQHQYQQQHRHYDWQATKHNRNFENRQSMIDQTPITRFVTHNPRRMSLPKAMTDSQLAYILEKERHITSEFDKLEKDRQRLLQELEEMQVNQSFEDFYKQHKKRNSLLPTLGPLSEEERMKKRMQEEWLSKVAEREERRLQKVIKVTHGTSEISPPYKSLTNRGLSDEFLERVKERRTKLHIPSDSDWDSGAESQPIKREPVSPNIDPTVKVIDDGHEADIKQLPKHLREFAEFTTKCEASESKSQCDTNATSTIKTESKEIIHTIERCDNQDGIWSPSGTPQPIRRAFPNEGGQFKSEPSLVHSTPSTPVAERRDIRSVKFESPITPRKNLSQQTHSGSTPSLTQPTIIVQPPPTSPKYKEHSTSEHGADHSKIRSYYPAGVRQINDASYSHNEYVTQRQNLENERQRKMASDGRTGEPVEVTSRSEANDNQHEWYKKMYNTIHKVSDGDGYVTVRYKTRRAGQYPYKTSTNGYASEPERNYNSDYSIKYKTLDRRRNPSSENVYRTLPNPMKSTNVSYKNQPGKIENFTPGHSSATDKERREEQIKTRNEINKVCEGNLSRALKDQGYESDSTLVFRKKDSSQIAPLSPVEQKQAYLNLQAGGEAPLQGFRKPAPEKPRECENTVPPPPPPPAKGAYYYNTEQPDLESARRYVESDVNIHYKTPVRYEIKDPISDAELIHRQEQAKKLYQEERRRKYLQELQDLNNRRHTDNFTPSQKSPISLHRYDDFGTIYDYVTKSSNYPKTVARALYNFQGQTSRELSFKKGDIIHIRREIDNNWYEGEINATIGLLPANYVEIISKDGVRLPTKKPTEGQARAKFNFQAQSAIELSLHKGELVVLTRRVDDNWFEGRVANQKGIFPVSYVEVLTDIGSDALPVVPSKPVGAPASHSLITSPNYQLSPRSNYSTDFTTTTNIISNGNHSPVVRETSKTLQKTEVLHVDTTNSEPVPYRAIYKYRPQNSDELELQEGDTVYVLEKCDDGWFVGTSQRTGFFGTFPGNYVEKLLL